MKRFAFAVLPAMLSSVAFANFSDTAQVVSSTPIMDRVSTPRQECWNEQMPVAVQRPIETTQYNAPAPVASSQSSGGSAAGTILGAIIGGVVGHQFGNSTGGRDRGTVAGAVVGGLVGNAIGSSASATTAPSTTNYTQGVQPSVYSPSAQAADTATRTVERCRTVADAREQITGYNVTYRYGNQTYTTRMATDPGTTIRVRVNVAPEIGR